jgi:hypothetical protein
VSEAGALHDDGADEVIAEEFETSVEIFTVVLHKYFVPRDKIEAFISDVRAYGYQMLRSRSAVQGTLRDLVPHIPTITITSFTIKPGSPLAGTTLGRFNLRKRYNLLVLAIRRGDEMITSPGRPAPKRGKSRSFMHPRKISQRAPDCSFPRTGPDILPSGSFPVFIVPFLSNRKY